MATVVKNAGKPHFGVDTTRFPQLSSHFSGEQIDRLFEDDLSAGRSVTGVLLSVITAGLVLAIVSTIAVFAWYV